MSRRLCSTPASMGSSLPWRSLTQLQGWPFSVRITYIKIVKLPQHSAGAVGHRETSNALPNTGNDPRPWCLRTVDEDCALFSDETPAVRPPKVSAATVGDTSWKSCAGYGPSGKGPGWFTGRVRIYPMLTPQTGYKAPASNLSPAPAQLGIRPPGKRCSSRPASGARNVPAADRRDPAGGSPMVRAGEKHRYGALPSTAMPHIALQKC